MGEAQRGGVRWSGQHRLWHWATALVVVALIATFIARETVLDRVANAEAIRAALASKGMALPEDLATLAAKAIRRRLWQWHPIVGFALVALLLARGVSFARGERRTWRESALGSSALRRALGTPEGRASLGHRRLHRAGVYCVYLGFYALAATTAVLGLLLYFEDGLGLASGTVGALEEVHEAIGWALLGFVVLHVGGVTLAELTSEPGVASEMLSGKALVAEDD